MSTSSSNTTSQHHTQKQSNPELSQPSHNSQQQHPDITKEEFERISEALKKEEFRKLFLDYIEEIQDPENRKRYEEEIKQIEAERGVDVVFIHPQPGFVIKTSENGSQKCFINCAKSEHVAKPTNQICFDHKTGTRGISWSIPMAQAPPRDDLDNNKKRCRVYDVVFHPDALYLAERNTSFHKCLVDTALDAVERENKVNLDRVNIKFPKLQFKGVARSTVIRKLAKDPPVEFEEPHPLDNIYPAKPTAHAGIPKVLPMKTIDCSKQTTTTTMMPDYCTPKYTIKHRHDVDLADYTHELDAKLHISIPRELVVDIELPLLNSSNECQLDVTEKTVFLLSERVGAKYRLNIDLPFEVNDKEGSAKFDVDTRRLSLTLPVKRPNIKKQRQMHDSLLHLSREDSGVESDMRDEFLSINRESPVEKINPTTIQRSLNKEENALHKAKEVEQQFLDSNIVYQLPAKFDCNVLDNTMSWVLHIRNVQEDSLRMKHGDYGLHLKFISVGSGYYPAHYSFYIQLSLEEKEAKIIEADAEAWENNVILNVHLNTSAESMSSYLAGLDSDNLQEYVIQEKLKVAHKSRQRQKENQPSLDISIERSECEEKSIEIEIKTRAVEMSACNANTTDDDEELNQYAINATQTNQKKVNKKQKRKNKIRRSLSESACDDIKTYQQQQQQKLKHSIAQIPVPEVNESEHDENAEDADDDEDEEDSSNESTDKSAKSLHPTSQSMKVPSANSSSSFNNNNSNNSVLAQQRKQRSFSESRDSAISFSAGSSSYKGILKHYSRYEPQPSISDSYDSIDDLSSLTYSTSVDGMASAFNSLRFSQSFSDIPEENVVSLSESCKKTVRFSEVIKKQVFRLDSSILGQRKKNQKRRDRKQRALQRRLSEGDSADYEDNKPMAPLPASTPRLQFLKSKNNQQNIANNCKNGGNTYKYKGSDKKSNRMRSRLESESSSDVDNHKNAMMFEMDM